MRDRRLLATGLYQMVWGLLRTGFWCVNLMQNILPYPLSSLMKILRTPVTNWCAEVELELFFVSCFRSRSNQQQIQTNLP
jgi:hypothetical protein